MKKPDISMNPGGDEAVAKGCTCPQMDNCRGQGRYGSGEFWIHKGCPLHDKGIDLSVGTCSIHGVGFDKHRDWCPND